MAKNDEEKPRTVSRADYAWCDGCAGYILKTHLKKRDGFFDDESSALHCPAGHEVKEEAAKK